MKFFTTLAALVCSLSVPGSFAGDGEAYSCASGVNAYLEATRIVSESPLKVAVIERGASASPAISVAIAEDATFLRYQFERKLRKLTASHREQCLKLAFGMYEVLELYAAKRLESLLSASKLDAFYSESQNWIAPRSRKEERAQALEKLLLPLEGAYLSIVHRALLGSLAETEWAHYSKLRVEIASWSQEWSALTGRDAPAAVYFEEPRIALRPLEYAPDELEIFLFHELSHLADSRFGPNRPFENELHAWRETFAYLAHRSKRGQKTPRFFVPVLESVKSLGLEDWVTAVFDWAHRH